MNSRPTAIRIVLMDDHEIVRSALAELLATDESFEVVGQCGRVGEIVALVQELQPDIALLDVQLPDGNGIEACRMVRSVAPNVRCLMLTSCDDEDSLLSALMAGASGYLLKSLRARVLFDALRKVAAGESLIDPQTAERLIERVLNGTPSQNRLSSLTADERVVLDHVGDGRTDPEISLLTNTDLHQIEETVQSIMYKIGLNRRVQVAVFAVEVRRR